MSKLWRFLLLIGVIVVLLGPPAHSAESGAGVYAMGYQSSMAGFLPPPGFYGRLDYYWYQGNARILPLSGRIEANLRNRYMAGVLGLTYVSPLQLLDANYAAGMIWAPIANNFIKGTAQAGNILSVTREGDYTGVGDLILTPLILGWHTEYLHFIGLFNTYAPVGSYNTSRILNTGFSRWAVEPNVGVTFRHPKYGQEVSVFMGYTVNFENPTTKYTTGNEFHLEYFIGQHLPKGFALGLAGYYYQQVTGDSGPGARLGPFKGTSVALGPCLTYNPQIAGYPVGVNVRYYNEVYVKNRLDGQSIFITLTGGFPKK